MLAFRCESVAGPGGHACCVGRKRQPGGARSTRGTVPFPRLAGLRANRREVPPQRESRAVSGAAAHEGRKAQDTEKDRLYHAHGIAVVRRYAEEQARDHPEAIVAEFLRDLETLA
jgi:hypothetical protein